MAIQNSNSTLLLPSTTHVINIADSHDRATFSAVSQVKAEPMDIDSYDSGNLDVIVFINIILFVIAVYILLRTVVVSERYI